uniref:PuwC n=2 Tax=Cylindrospermum TaxID=56106 RepID=A0A346GB33_9NOST|nr:PuwC [Cylindrospermum moravicum CCALA 993]AXN93587.1 PuwC [Cylindrospermum alatosporum CCALA 994]
MQDSKFKIQNSKFKIQNPDFSTFVELLRYRAISQPDKIAFTFLQDGETETGSLTYQALDQQAKAIAVQLESVVAKGDRAIMLYPSGLEFITAFFGCLYAGVVAIPAYPPRRNQNLFRLQSIVTDAQATVALTTAALSSDLKQWFNQNSELATVKWLVTDEIDSNLASVWQQPELNSNTLAFLQYTSGSTGTPKGVMVSHSNLLYNEEMIKVGFQNTEQSIIAGWLPFFHDMGLMANLLQAVYLGVPCFFMPPVAFLQRPYRWLQVISRYKATSSGAPNFAYDLCVNKITPEQISSLDLSSWDLAFNGAEPVNPATLDRFTAKFAAYGFRREAFYPGYGMAETTLLISGGLRKAAPVVLSVAGSNLEENRVLVTTDEQEGSKKIVGCGQTLLEQKIAIADPETLTHCSPEQVGEIWVSGANVAGGYWNRPEETEQTFHSYFADTGEGPFLRTGDLGFLRDGELFITGRIKDVIIIRGRNHYPQDIEVTVEQSHPALRPSNGAAFTVTVNEQEKLIVVQEVERTWLRKLDGETVVKAIRLAVSQQHELQVYAAVLIKTGSIPKTSSGKIQRRACRAKYLAGTLEELTSEKSS